MGFSEFEKKFMRSLLETDEIITPQRDAILNESVKNFLEKDKHINRVRDYGIFPFFLHKKHRSENVILSKFLTQSFSLYEFIFLLLEEISMPFTLMIDFTMIIKNPLTTSNEINVDYRFVFPQRSTSFEITRKIYTEKDINSLLNYLKPLSYNDLLSICYHNHKNQSCFDKSGYVPYCLLTAVIFLSKISTLNPPIQI